MTLLEVLASIGVMSIGLLGLAALLPVGQFIINQATIADHVGETGRAALRDIVVRRMLSAAPAGGSAAFAIDPQGTGQFGGSLNTVPPPGGAGGTVSTDDLIVPLPPSGRPTAALTYKGSYSWFATVIPAPGSSTRFTVSVAVCNGRGSQATSTIPAGTPAAGAAGFLDGGIGGGSVVLSAPLGGLQMNNWIALCGGGVCHWYRVAAAGSDGVSLTLVGPDWNPAIAATAVDMGQSVLGVYTTTLEMDTDPTWQK